MTPDHHATPPPVADGEGFRSPPAPAWRRWSGSARDVAAGSLVVCLVTGVALHGFYDPQDGARSVAEWLLAQPGLVLLRNLHYWTAHLLVVSTLVTLWQTPSKNPGAPLGRCRRLALALTLPGLAFLMATGFLLRGDADARDFQPLFTALLAEMPFVGRSLVAQLFHAENPLPAVLFHHGLTVAAAVAILFAMQWRRPLPRPAVIAAVAGAALVVSLVLSPGLNDGLDRRVAGPWLFLGAQTALRWLPDALLLVMVACAALWAWWALPRFSPAAARWIRLGLVAAAAAYLALIAIGLFPAAASRPPSWRWPTSRGDWRLGSIVPPTGTPAGPRTAVPIVLGRAEGCLICHGNLTGLGPSHRPEAIGCAACHGGDTTTLDPDRAHAAMIRIPGNLSDAPHTCGTAGCHADIVPRVERSIMATFSGVIDVNRRIFGEPTNPTAPPPHVRDLGRSASDSHLRQLCVSCHLGQEKAAWGPITQESRGGGCNACHLVYPTAAAQALERYENAPLSTRTAIPTVHPSLTVNPENSHCFGCHSRSGRISLSFEGWHELREPPAPEELRTDPPAAPRYRRLDDGRTLLQVSPDVHQTRGLDCIDCHTSTEVMGGGHVVRRKSEQLQVRCEDCHAPRLAAQAAAAVDAESHKLMGLRQESLAPGQQLGRTRDGGTLVNLIVNPDGSGVLRRKRTGAELPLRPPAEACRAGAGHSRLSCASCHTAWAPRCASCHTSFDPKAEGFDHLDQVETKGTWIEKSGAFTAAPPTLGIRLDPADPARPQGLVDTFVPGMILELDRNRTLGAAPDPVFHRLYAHMAPHTTTREARSCQSCHNDPVALGYGEGELRFESEGSTGRWRFLPKHAALPQDGLPADAWVGFLRDRTGMVSTRDDVRPFSVPEQRRILTVGACLTCHSDQSPPLQQSIADFAAVLGRRTGACRLPVWSD